MSASSDGREGREGRLANIVGVVLTGGTSARMGRDKANLELGGVALATKLARLLGLYFTEVLLVGGDPPADAPGKRIPDVDTEAPSCALRGVISALGYTSAEGALVVATDLPLVTADLILGLTAWPEHDAVVPRRPSGPEPLCALYRRDPVLAKARTQLESGELAMQSLLGAVDTSYLEGADLDALDPSGTALLNLNTPEDLERARSLLQL